MKTSYEAAAQNWEVDVMSNGKICFANSHGLLTFNGKKWDLHEVESAPILRAVKCDGDSIFVGGYNTVGYLKNISGSWQFTNLLNYEIDDEIWKIIKIQNKFFFQGFSAVYMFENGVVKTFKLKEPISYSSYSEYGILYAQSDTIMSLFDQEKHLIPIDNRIEKVHAIVQFSDKTLIATQSDGIFMYSDSQLTYHDGELSNLLKTARINKLYQLDDNMIAFATYQGGVILTDKNLNITRIINQDNGLPNNRVHGVAYSNGLLWIATDNGIASISIKKNVNIYNSTPLGMGTSYDIIRYENDLYLGTNQGLYQLSQKDANATSYRVSKINVINGQVWDMFEIDSKLHCALDNGVYELHDNNLIPFSSVLGGRSFQTLNFNSNIAVQGCFSGIMIYEKLEDQWELYPEPIALQEYIVTEILQGYQRNIWVKTFQGKIFRVRLSANGKSAESIDELELPEKKNYAHSFMFDIDGSPIFLKGNTTYSYVGNSFAKNDQIPFENITYVSSSFGKNVLINSKSQCSLYNLSDKTSVNLGRIEARMLDKLVYKYENITELSDGRIGICTEDGFALISQLEDLGIDSEYNPIEIEKLTYRNYQNIRQNKTFGKDDNLVFPRGAKYIISVYFSASNFNQEALYSYQLIQNNKVIEQGIVSENKLDIINKGYGNFTLSIVEKNSNKPPAKLTFEIQTPVLVSQLAITIYSIILLIICHFIILSYRKHMIKKKSLEEQKIQQEIKLIQEKREYEDRLILMEKTINEREKDLTYLATRVLKDKGALSSVLELLADSTEEGVENLKQRFNKSAKEFDPTSKEMLKDWELFEHNFQKGNPNFYAVLRERCPSLTDDDLRLCVYIRTGLLSKEIAPLFHITIRSLELKRYRMRKKLGLSSQASLTNFLTEL